MHPVEVQGDQPGFVALDGTDAVPLQPQVSQQSDFLHRLLDVVFAEGALPGIKRLLHSDVIDITPLDDLDAQLGNSTADNSAFETDLDTEEPIDSETREDVPDHE